MGNPDPLVQADECVLPRQPIQLNHGAPVVVRSQRPHPRQALALAFDQDRIAGGKTECGQDLLTDADDTLLQVLQVRFHDAQAGTECRCGVIAGRFVERDGHGRISGYVGERHNGICGLFPCDLRILRTTDHRRFRNILANRRAGNH